MFDRRLIQNFDWGLLGVTLLLSAVGLLILKSALSAAGCTQDALLFYKQLIWLGAGFLLMTLIVLFHYRHLEKWGPLIYFLCILSLICVYLFGKHVGGSTRWLAVGPFTLQPSEPVKIGVVIILSRFFARHVRLSGLNFIHLIVPLVLTAVPFLLISAQPDLGTAGILALIAGSMTLFAKIEKKTLVISLMAIIIAIPAGWKMLEPYQQNRVMTLLSPGRDPLGAGYHIRQSKIAVGSGMVFGKGYMQGTQKMLSFLPEQHTDFIFSVLAEEWGFTGSIGLLFLYLLLIAFGLNVAHTCRDAFGTFLAMGITAMIFWQTFINIAMVMGLMPVVGMPLPLISYGGSSVITILVGVGILLNISMRRFMKE